MHLVGYSLASRVILVLRFAPAAWDSPAVRSLGFGCFAAGQAAGWPASWGKPSLRQFPSGQFVAARQTFLASGVPKARGLRAPHCRRMLRPNKSFKPNLSRCAGQVGLILVLGLTR